MILCTPFTACPKTSLKLVDSTALF